MPNLKFFWANNSPAGPHNFFPAAPPMPGGVRGGVRPSRPLRPKFRQGFPPASITRIFSGPVAHLSGPLAAFLPPPPCACKRVWGGLDLSKAADRNFAKGSPPWGQNFQIFHLARCLNYPARLRPTKGGTHTRVRVVRGRRWLMTSAGSITLGS